MFKSIVSKLGHLRGPREVTFDLATKEVAGPLQLTSSGLFCWFILGPQGWDFRTLPERTRLWDQQTYRYAALASGVEQGRPIRLRVTTKPYPTYEFARSLDEDTAGNGGPLPDVAGAESWDDYLVLAQSRLQSTGLDQKIVAMGVWICPPLKPAVWEELVRGDRHPSRETVQVINDLLAVEKTVAGPGLGGRRATPAEMASLFHRSLSMGIPSPVHAGSGGARWSLDDMAEFTDRRAWLTEPYGSAVEVISENQGKRVSRWVNVLTMGVMPDITWPENGQDPWMLSSARLPFPVEWSLSGALLPTKSTAGAIEFEQRRAEGIRAHYHEHDMTPPPAVARAITGAAKALDEVTEGDTRTAVRFLGTIRAAVYGRTQDEALDRGRTLCDWYGERQNMQLTPTMGQAEDLREFIPAEPRQMAGYQRRMPVKYLAAAMPNVDSVLGTTGAGPYIGYGVGSARRAVRFDMHYGPERLNAPGLFPIVAEPGGGKSVLIGVLAYNAVRAGQPTIIFDPSGPLARLCDLPELKPHARELDLTAAESGSLSPYQLIPEPTRQSAEDSHGVVDEIQYSNDVRRAALERQQLMFDVLRMWLPSSVLRRSGTDVALRDALREVERMAASKLTPHVEINPRWVVECLQAKARDTTDPQQRSLLQEIVDELLAAAEFPLGELIMPPHSNPIRDQAVSDATLVVVTMPGLAPPPEGVEREDWGAEERYTQPLLHLAAFFASRFIYRRPRDQRKNVFLDENHLMGQWGSGRAFFIRLSRDSRKWNTAIGAASQHPDDHLSIGKVDALMGSAFVGRLTSHETAVAACKLVQCHPDYATVIQSLSPKPVEGSTTPDDDSLGGGVEVAQTGEFVWRDPMGRVGRLRIDLDWHPSLRQALQTTPGRVRPVGPLNLQPTPFIDPDLFSTIPTIPITEPQALKDGAAA